MLKYVVQLALHVYTLHDEAVIKPMEHCYEVSSVKKRVTASLLDTEASTKKMFNLDGFDTVTIEQGVDANLWVGRYIVMVDSLEQVNKQAIYAEIAREIMGVIGKKQQQLSTMLTLTNSYLG